MAAAGYGKNRQHLYSPSRTNDYSNFHFVPITVFMFLLKLGPYLFLFRGITLQRGKQ